MRADVTILHFSSKSPPDSFLYYVQSINMDTYCVFNTYLPSEAMTLKTSITFIAGTLETHALLIDLKILIHV